ncbi:MAG: flagellar hook-length control protein FliK [Halanaerobiales bacterium]|nr:flagellar hook-length control protein FliK [Halanaerobiales bacterium]
MNGIESVANFTMQASQVSQKNNTPETKTGNSSGISFGQILQQGYQKQNSPEETRKLSNEEEELLFQSLGYLGACKEKLAENLKEGNASIHSKLSQLMEKISQDKNFLENLPDDLKDILNKYFRSFMTLSDLQTSNLEDAKKIKNLLVSWEEEQAKKDSKILKEVEDLISAIESILCRAGVAEVKGNEPEKVSLGIYDKILLSDFVTDMKKNQKGVSGLMAKNILSKVSKFFNKTDDSLEKIALKEETFDLRESLKKYLTKDTLPVDLSKRNLVQKTQEMAINKLHVEDMEMHPLQKTVDKNLTDQMTKKLIKEGLGAKEEKFISGTDMNKVESKDNKHSGANTDFYFTPNMTNRETNSLNAPPNVRQQLFLQPDQIFEQIVDQFTVHLRNGSSEMEMLLYPEELGRVQLKLIQEDGILTAHFIVESMQVKEIIEQNLSQLRNTFGRDNELQWEKITVDVGSEQLGENPFGYQGQEDGRDQQRRSSNSKKGFTEEGLDDEGLLAVEEIESETSTSKDPNRLVDYLA